MVGRHGKASVRRTAQDCMVARYRGTSLIKKRHPAYAEGPMAVLWGGAVLVREVPP